jgi:hypothetical protein
VQSSDRHGTVSRNDGLDARRVSIPHGLRHDIRHTEARRNPLRRRLCGGEREFSRCSDLRDAGRPRICPGDGINETCDSASASLFFPLSRALDEALRRLMALAGALLEVFGLVVVALEALQDLGDARFPFFSLRS